MNSQTVITDEQLVAAFKQQAAWAADEIYRRYYQRVVELCNRQLNSMSDAEDTAQNVFFKVIMRKKLNDFRGQCQLWAWLKRIAINECCQLFRQRRRRQEVNLVNDDHEPIPLSELAAASEPDPMQILLQDETARQMQSGLQQLAACYQHAIILTCFQGQNYSQAARTMRLSVRALGVYRHRGLKYLAKVLKGEKLKSCTQAAVTGKPGVCRPAA